MPHPQLFHSRAVFPEVRQQESTQLLSPLARTWGDITHGRALQKKGTDGSFIARLEMFPRLLFSSPIHSSQIPRICQLESIEAAAGGPGPPRAPARGRALAVAPSPARQGGSAVRTQAAGVREASVLTPALGPSVLLNQAATLDPRRFRGHGERQLQSKGCTWHASALDAPLPPRSGVGEEQPGGGDYRAPRSFLSGLETWAMGASGTGGSRRGI